MQRAIVLMKDFLMTRNYDIEVEENRLTIVKNSDDPWNHFNKYIAKPDGVYNYVEVHMGGYSEKKRVCCNDFETACFAVLTIFVSREQKQLTDDSLMTEIKKHAKFIVNNLSDYWRGQFIIDELISHTK